MGTMIPVVRAKDGVTLKPAPAGFRILSALDQLSKILGSDVVITCGSDSHPASDVHSLGEAYDVRVSDWTIPVTLKAVTFLKQVLGDRFTVLYETTVAPGEPALQAIAYVNGNASGPHLHVQRKKGTIYPPDQQQANPSAGALA